LGIFNILTKLGLPILALAILALTGEPTAGLVVGAVVGLVLLLLGVAGLLAALRGGRGYALRVLESLLTLAFRLTRRPAPWHLGPALADFPPPPAALGHRKPGAPSPRHRLARRRPSGLPR
jgi:hypothetical protein